MVEGGGVRSCVTALACTTEKQKSNDGCKNEKLLLLSLSLSLSISLSNTILFFSVFVVVAIEVDGIT